MLFNSAKLLLDSDPSAFETGGVQYTARTLAVAMDSAAFGFAFRYRNSLWGTLNDIFLTQEELHSLKFSVLVKPNENLKIISKINPRSVALFTLEDIPV